MSRKRIKRRKPRNAIVNISLEVPPEDLEAYGRLLGKKRPATKAELARLIREVVDDRLARLRTVAHNPPGTTNQEESNETQNSTDVSSPAHQQSGAQDREPQVLRS